MVGKPRANIPGEIGLSVQAVVDRVESEFMKDDQTSERFREEYLTVAELSQRIGYSPQSIRNMMSQGVFQMGVHYVKPRRRVLFKWSTMVAWLHRESVAIDIPLTRGP
jgi:hypothetical protein